MSLTSGGVQAGGATSGALWEEEKKYRYSCEVLTHLLRDQVPVLHFVQWKVEAVEQGFARTVLPLISPSTNQHCTHQAALLFLAADYTGGIALASLVPGWPVIGVHPVIAGDKSMSLWLVKGEIKFFRPSVGRLDIVAEVEADRHDRVRKRYAQGKTVLETITVRFRNGAVDVAEAVMTYYARQSEKLRCDGSSPENVNILYQHKLISSAELIAGVRAREHGKLFEDPYAAIVAGEHGLALANRFCEKSPQLGGMVAARTRHLDLSIEEFLRSGGRDVVLLGAGFDMRPFRLDFPAGTTVYELDFSTVLADRQERIRRMGLATPDGVQRVQVPIDLRTTRLCEALEGKLDFTAPVFVAWEGMSMYFEESDVRAVLRGIAPLLLNNRSRLWADFVEQRAVERPDEYPEVLAFMQGMQRLGEPFVFGPGRVADFVESEHYRCLETAPSDLFLAQRSDPVYSIYHFCVAGMTPALVEAVRTTIMPGWVTHAAHELGPAGPIEPQRIPDPRLG